MDGRLQTGSCAIQQTFLSYFHDLFKFRGSTNMDGVISYIQPWVTEVMNRALISLFTAEEIKISLFHVHPTKALGEDGMRAIFFQKYGHLVGDHVYALCLNNGEDLS